MKMINMFKMNLLKRIWHECAMASIAGGKVWTGLSVVFIISMSSCGDFLQEFSQELAYAKDCNDLDELLIGNGYMNQEAGWGMYAGYYPYLQVMDDDVSKDYYGSGNENGDKTLQYTYFYEWSHQLNINPKTGEEWKDNDWKKFYNHIGYLNVILGQVGEYTQDSLKLRNRIEGEARFLRGAYYYLLVNLYAEPYVKEYATTTLGVPLNLSNEIQDVYFHRNRMAETYAVIVNDLKIAADKLKDVEQENCYRVDEADARVLLSRVYLYMGEWQLALDECDKIAEMRKVKRELLDLNTWEPEIEDDRGKVTRQYLLTKTNPEVMFTQGTSFMSGFDMSTVMESYYARFCASQELLDLYYEYEELGLVDLRMDAFFIEMYSKVNYFPVKISMAAYVDVFDCFVIRTPEYYLNRAEAAAMLDKTDDAITTLKDFLVTRFKDGKIPPIDGLQGEELIKFIRTERRREFCFESQRWFDLRRYAVSPKYPEKKSIKHNVYSFSPTGIEAVYEGSYTLKPYGEDPAWVLPIPGYEIIYNHGALVDNPERQKREMD